ncbi:MAG: hypothetical protein J7L39_02550 [Candidatus Aenigmarchaeota archaeon]|nr:hypothetical protein [Candidatus Aenigmarchaeota archaeon]
MKLRKIFLPKWTAWFIALLLLIILIFDYYEKFISEPKDNLEFYFTAIIFGLIVAFVLFISYKQIPYLLIGR